MMATGELSGFKVGGQWRFKRADLDQCVEEQKQGASARLGATAHKQSAPAKHSTQSKKTRPKALTKKSDPQKKDAKKATAGAKKSSTESAASKTRR